MTDAQSDLEGRDARSEAVEAWRRRARMVRLLRVLLPAVIALIFVILAGGVVYRSLKGAGARPDEAEAPIRLVNPRFVGRDAQGRSFVITAGSATRDQKDYQRVLLVEPALVLDEGGPEPTRVAAARGVYHEGTRRLQLEGGVKLTLKGQTFDTPQSLYDAASGELSGDGVITGSGPLGEMVAKSYGVYDKGERMIFRGGVRARIPND